MFCDNNAVVFFSKNNKRTLTSRLIDVKFLKRGSNEEGDIEVQYLSTNLIIVDPLTKPLPNNVFKDHVTRMGVVESFNKWE